MKKSLLIVFFMSLSLLVSSCGDVEIDNTNKGNNTNTDSNTDGGMLSTKSKIKLQCNGIYYINEPFTINVTTDDNRKVNPLSWNQNTENSEISMNVNGNTATILAKKEANVFINVIEDGTNYESECSFKVIKKTDNPVIPVKTPIKLQCSDEYLEGSEFDLYLTTDDNRVINKTIWSKDSDNIQLTPDNYNPYSARIKALSAGKVTINVVEPETNYSSQCTFLVKEEQPQIYLEKYDYSFVVGETKTIKYAIIPKKQNQAIEIKQPQPEGYEFKIRDGEIEVKSLKEQGMTELVLVSKNLNLESSPIYLSSSTDFTFTLDTENTGSTKFNDNKAHSFSVKINKNSEFTSYKLYKDNFPSWIHVDGPKKITSFIDEYTFSLEENKRVRRHEYEIVFLPGNVTNINDKKAQKIKVTQDRNYAPEQRTIKFFKGAKTHTAKDFLEEWDYNKEHYTTGKVPEYYLYENGFEGWYNSNKLIGKESSMPIKGQDTNMCWAYAATNALHWWLEHNEQEVKKYMEYKKPAETDTVRYNEGYYNTKYIPSTKLDIASFSDNTNKIARENKSDIAKVFRKVYTENKGGFPNEAILWYLSGKEYIDHNHPNKAGFGLVKDIFPTADVNDLVMRISLIEMTQDKLNKLFEEAIAKDRIFLLNIKYNNGALHAVNVWGYVVDGYGDVCEIYIGDNNLPSSQDDDYNNDKSLINIPVYQKPSDSYLLKYGIDVKSNGDIYLMNLTGKRHTGAQMNLFYELDLGKKYFKEYFEKHNIQ